MIGREKVNFLYFSIFASLILTMSLYFQLTTLEYFSVNFWVPLIFLKIGWLRFPRFMSFFKRFFQIFHAISTINLKYFFFFWFSSKQVLTYELILKVPSGPGQVKTRLLRPS